MEAVIDTSDADDDVVKDEAEWLTGYVTAAINEGDATPTEMIMALGVVMQALINMIQSDHVVH